MEACSYSFNFIDHSIRKGRLEKLEDHLVGPAQKTSRPVGALQPASTGRVPFTMQDDQLLWDWMEDYASKGGKIKGNESYKQLGVTVRVTVKW
jgi:telomeric repeat-binding factor 2-interacting protein 1